MDNDTTTLAKNGYWPAVARQYFDEGKYARTVELCLRMLDEEPQVLSGRILLARALYHTGQITQAREQFMEILKTDANHLVALKYMGDILFRDGEEAAAIAYYRRVFEIDPACEGLACPLSQRDVVKTTHLTIKRGAENAPRRDRSPLREPAFITETVGDIYRDQGYLQLAGEVYRRLLHNRLNDRVAGKLKDIEEKLAKGKGIYEDANSEA